MGGFGQPSDELIKITHWVVVASDGAHWLNQINKPKCKNRPVFYKEHQPKLHFSLHFWSMKPKNKVNVLSCFQMAASWLLDPMTTSSTSTMWQRVAGVTPASGNVMWVQYLFPGFSLDPVWLSVTVFCSMPVAMVAITANAYYSVLFSEQSKKYDEI